MLGIKYLTYIASWESLTILKHNILFQQEFLKVKLLRLAYGFFSSKIRDCSKWYIKEELCIVWTYSYSEVYKVSQEDIQEIHLKDFTEGRSSLSAQPY